MRLGITVVWPNVLLASVFAPSAQAAFVTFNTASDLSAFNQRDEFQFRPFAWSAGGGVGETGSLVMVGLGSYATYAERSFEMRSPGATLTVSTYFKTKDVGTIQPGMAHTYGQIYLTREPDDYFFTDDSAYVAFESTADADHIVGGSLPAGGGSFPRFEATLPPGTVRPLTWYELKVEYQNLGHSRLGWSIDVNEYGADGTAFVGNILTSRHETEDPLGFTVNSAIYAGIGSERSSTSAIDNFAVFVPEVSTFNLLMCGATVLILRKTYRGTVLRRR
jgi:hypothetical protein